MHTQEIHRESIVVLFKGGRLPEWESLSDQTRRAYEQEHVDLMLSVAQTHRLMRLEGFKLLAPQSRWKYSWIIEFPTLAGAEAWIAAEMAPPYGRYGRYEYYLARRYATERFAEWVSHPRPASPPVEGDPRHVPALGVDTSSCVALLFGRWRPEAGDADALQRGDAGHIELMLSVARAQRLMHLEAFQLIAPQPDWHRMWVIEFPTQSGVEAWMEAETRPPHGRYADKRFYLARRWAPEYFRMWSVQEP
jgi:hypothetical protein